MDRVRRVRLVNRDDDSQRDLAPPPEWRTPEAARRTIATKREAAMQQPDTPARHLVLRELALMEMLLDTWEAGPDATTTPLRYAGPPMTWDALGAALHAIATGEATLQVIRKDDAQQRRGRGPKYRRRER